MFTNLDVSTSIRKAGRASHLPHLSWNHTGHSMHGDQTPTRQTTQNSWVIFWVEWLQKKLAKSSKILFLVGLFQHATRVISCGCTFMAWMYTTAAKVKELCYFTALNKEFQLDIAWWYSFIQCWNGLSMLSTNSSPLLQIYHSYRRFWLLGLQCLHKWKT